MTVEEFYLSVGGDYRMAVATFKTDEKIHKYLKMYLEDEYYDRLSEADKIGDVHEAFEASHALKGVTGMFYLTRLYKAIVDLVEQLRAQDKPIDDHLFQRVKEEQQLVVSGIEKITV